MIGKIVRGASFKGIVEYALQERKGYLLDSNMAATSPRGLVREFCAIKRLRPNLTKAVEHIVISAAPEDKISEEDWIEIGQGCLERLGFSTTYNQYVIVRHVDTPNDHIHIIANKITTNGEVVNTWRDSNKLMNFIQEIEKSYLLRQIREKEREKRRPTKNELEMMHRTGEDSLKIQLQNICDEAIKKSRTFTEYVKNLEAAGVGTIPRTQLENRKLYGISYSFGKLTVKGSSLGKKYAALGIQKRGISYDFERDFPTVQACWEKYPERKETREKEPPAETN